MKKIYIVLINLLFASALFAQTDGSLDLSFGNNGKVITDFQQWDRGYSVALQADGKIILAGYSTIPFPPNTNYVFALARYNSNGTLDNTFDGDGKVTYDFAYTASFDEYGWSVVIQPDGKIIVAGEHCNVNMDFALVRFNSNGSVDSTFGNNGQVQTDLGQQDGGQTVVLQDDGKIIVAGVTGLTPSVYDFALARYNADGTLDNAFGTNGKVITDFGDREEGWSLKIQPDHKILLGGFSGTDFAITRYNPDGTLDNTFNTTGKVTTDLGGTDVAQSLVLQNDGKIILAGSVDSDYVYCLALVRYNTDGSLDNTFGVNGKSKYQCLGQCWGNSVALQSDGKIILGGEVLQDFAVARFNNNGSIDNSFGTNGLAMVDFNGWADQGFSVAIQPDGKIVLGGNIYNGSNQDFALARFLATPTSVNEIVESSDNIHIYPNPVSNEVVIEMKENNETFNFEILNAIGQVVYKGIMKEKTTVHANGFASGIYTINLRNDKTFKTIKFIKE